MKSVAFARPDSVDPRAAVDMVLAVEPRPRQVRQPAIGAFLKLHKLAAVVLASLTVPMCYAAADYTADTAPDAVSKSVLAVQVLRPEEGAVNSDDIAPAIHRNFPKIIEQNLAARNERAAMAWIDQLSDLELDHMAQLYVNANASAARTGKLLQVAAARLDAAHLGRLAKFFGHAEVRAAVSHVAPKKLRSFEANSSPRFAAPIAGAALSAAPLMMRTSGGVMMASGSFTPQVSMSFEELYAGFRSMQVGSMAVAGAVYELAAYSGKYLVVAWGIGYGFGTGITYLMQEYEPDFYNDTFVNWVGAPVDWVQNFVLTSYNKGSNVQDLGQYQSTTLPTYGTSSSQIDSMGSMGGDWGTEYGYESFESAGGGGSGGSKDCPPATCKIQER